MKAGDRIASRYRLIEQTSEGERGEVWRAEEEQLGPVVVEVLHGTAPGARERFARAAALAKVAHPGVVDIIDVGATDEGDLYLVMPFLRGETMEARLRREPPPSLGEVLGWTRGVLGALAAIHDEGLALGDLSSENVFLAEDAEGFVPKLLGFGIPRGAETRVTRTAAPEQSESPGDERSDVWGVGAVLFEAFTGRPPSDGPDAPASYRDVATSGPVSLRETNPELPAELGTIVDRALSSDPNARFANARELHDAIDALRLAPSVTSSAVVRARGSGAPTLARPFADSPPAVGSAARPPSVAPSTSLAGETEMDRVPMRAARAEPKPKPRSAVLPFVLGALLLVLLGGAGVWVAFPSAEDAVAPADHADDAPSELFAPTAHVIAGPNRLSSLALAWARLSDADRALDLRIVPSGARWSLVAPPDVAEEQAQRVAAALGSTALAQPAWDDAHTLRPALLHTKVRLNVHDESDIRSPTRHVLAHDTLVVGLYGTYDGAVSSAEGDDAVTYFVVSSENAGWALSRFLEPHSGCMPAVDSFVDSRGHRTAMPANTTFARTHVEHFGARVPVFFVIARERRPARSILAIHAIEGGCTLGEQLDLREIDGVVDEAFFTETARAGGTSLLLASWHPRATPPTDGVLEWAAFAPDEPSPVWTDRLPTAAYLPRNRIGGVSGSRDRVVRIRREPYVLGIREPGEQRVFYFWQNDSLVLADPP